MESENPWEALRASLLEAGYSLDKIDKLENLMKKDEISPLLEKILERVKKLGEISSEVEKEIGTGEDISNRASLLFQSVKGIVISLIGDLAYMRPFLRDRGKVKEVKRILEVTLEEASSLERELVTRVNGYIREKGIDIEELRSYEEIPAALSFLRILKKSEVHKEVQEQKVEPKEEQRKVKEETLASLGEVFEKLRSIEEELDLMGVIYERLLHYLELQEKLIEKLQEVEEGVLRKYLKNITSRLAEVESDSRKLIQISQKLIDLKASIEEMKGDLLERMERIAELGKFKEIIPYIGLDFPKVPLLIRSRMYIESLRREVERLSRISSLIKSVIDELEYIPKDAKLDLSRLSFDSTESFLESLNNCLRASRLSYGMPETLGYTGIMSEILELYPKWREKIISLLRERGEISLQDLKFIPGSWRPWVLRNLADEGIVVVNEDKVAIRIIPEDMRKLEMEIEVIEDMISDLGVMLPNLDDKSVKRLREDFERAKSLFMMGRVSEYKELVSELRSRINEVKMQLGVKK
jgi:hypothetical protein